MTNSFGDEDLARGRVVAVVSGKGGSGKTMFSVVTAMFVSGSEDNVVLVDADTGTGGMSYYLGLKQLSGPAVGLSDLVGEDPGPGRQPISLLRRVNDRVAMLSVGNHRKLSRLGGKQSLPALLSRVVTELRDSYRWVIADCRGGIDEDSLAVCAAADDVLLVAETDTTSFQATQHLVDVLSDHDLGHKIRGFVLNKVIHNPSETARSGTAVFGTQFLGAIPFDLEATRAFLIGDIPEPGSVFGIHAAVAVAKGLAIDDLSPRGRPWQPEEFSEVGLTDLDSIRGGVFASTLLLVVSGVTIFLALETDTTISVVFGAAYQALIGLAGSLHSTRRAFGRALFAYSRILRRL